MLTQNEEIGELLSSYIVGPHHMCRTASKSFCTKTNTTKSPIGYEIQTHDNNRHL